MLNSRFLHICNHPFYFSPVTWTLGLLSNRQQFRQKQTFPLNNGQVKFLMDIFGCSYPKTYRIMNKHIALRTLDQNRIQKVADLLNRFGITKDDIANHPEVLSIFPITIENHAMLLQEGGFKNVTAAHLISYLIIMRKPVRLLKAHGYIPSDVNVVNSFFSKLVEPPPSFESIYSEDVSDDRAFMEVQLAVLKHYLMWRLEMTPETFNFIMETYTGLRNRSLRIMERALKILEEDIGFTKQKIHRHGYLIHSNPDNTLDTFHRVKTLGGMDIRTVFNKYPKIVVSPTDSLLKIVEHLKEFNIPDSAIKKCPELFTLNSDTVLQRLLALKAIPEFRGLIKHPRVLLLVHLQRKACTRLGYLQELKMKCASLHLLSTTQAKFDRHVREGGDRTKGNDVTYFLSLELNENEKTIRKMLCRQPFWYHVPLVAVRESFNFLFKRGFTKRHILLNIQILLYTRKQIEEELDLLPSRQELNRDWTSECPPSPETEYDTKPKYIPPEQRLALCLYYIERDYHFTGDGIWDENVISSVRADSSV